MLKVSAWLLLALSGPGALAADVPAAQAALLEAARAGDGPRLRKLLGKSGAKKKWLDAREPSSGQTLLMAAAMAGQAEAVEVLLEKGADRSIGEKDGLTPMHGVALHGWVNVARLLMMRGFDPSAYHSDGFAPYHRACWGSDDRHAATVKVFLLGGIDPKMPSKDGKTCLQMTRNPATSKLVKDWLNPEVDVAQLLSSASEVFAAKSGSVPSRDQLATCLNMGTGAMFLSGFADGLEQARLEESRVVRRGLTQLAGNVIALAQAAKSDCDAPEFDGHSLMALQQAAQTFQEGLANEDAFEFKHPKVMKINDVNVATQMRRLHEADRSKSGERGSGEAIGRQLGKLFARFAETAAHAPHAEL